MPRRLREILEDIGLNKREARVYLTVLQNREVTIADIARITLIPRMSCYGLVQEMVRKGFVDVLIQRKRKYLVAVAPQKILERLQRRTEEFKVALPAIEAYRKESTISSRVLFFEGTDGVRAVFRRILDEKRPFCAITSIDDAERVASNYFKEFISRRIKQGLKMRLLTNHTPASMQMKEQDEKELRETRFIKSGHALHTAEYIFNKAVAIVSFREEAPIALIIDDAEIAHTHAIYFELMWDSADK